jgi:ABC-type polysaccharide/polyol phosphate transport system ATPase subunit
MHDLIFNQVSKKYRIRQEREPDSSKHPIVQKLQGLRRRSQEFWAVRDVSFEVERGEALGIIGHNGAGKSTVLKLLSNITTPTAGEIKINGSLSALIEVGSGFHPELTGRENVYLNGSILGMRRREITKKLDDIVEFAGIRQFLDTPVKRYSSGMYVRLGFSIAAHLDPDILLLDEVLAVGDSAFQAKCLQRIDDLRRGGTTIVFISHDLGAVQRLCDRVLLMNHGEIAASGSPQDVINEYQRSNSDFSAPARAGDQPLEKPKSAEITALRFFDFDGNQTSTCSTGSPLIARIEYFARERVPDCAFEAFFYTADHQLHCQFTTELSDKRIDLEPGAGAVEFSCAEVGLLPALYYVDTTIKQRGGPMGCDIDWKCRRSVLRVDPGTIVRGSFYMPHEWRFEPSGNVACPTGSGQSLDRVHSEV